MKEGSKNIKTNEKRRVSLKLRITVLTASLLAVCSIALVVIINLYVNGMMSRAAENIVIGVGGIIEFPIQEGSPIAIPEEGVIEEGVIGERSEQEQGSSIEENTLLPNPIGPLQAETQVQPMDGKVVYGAIGDAVTNIHVASIVAILVVIVVGSGLAYYIISKALHPLTELTRQINDIDETNLKPYLKLDGSNDEILELKTSFNEMMGKIETLVSSQKRFNSDIAHELKTPLAVIKTNIDVLKEQEEISKEEYDQLLTLVNKSVNKMNGIIEILLDMIRQERMPLEDKVEIDQVIFDVVDDLRTIAMSKHVIIEAESSTDGIVKGNEILLYRTIYNIVENAIKYNRDYGTVHVIATKKGNMVEIQIKDTGIGMIQEEKDRIFEPFYRCDKEQKCKDSSLGLGLSLAQSVIRSHHGVITVDTSINEGTTMTIQLPLLLERS